MFGANYVIGGLSRTNNEKEWKLNKVDKWELKLCALPRRCLLSNQLIFGKMAYKGTRHIRNPDWTLLEEILWVEKHTFLLWQLGVTNDYK